MPMAAFITAVAPTVIGAVLGGSQSAPTTKEQNRTDPRLDPYIYGPDGIAKGWADWYAANKSGMNPQMRAGLDRQNAVYSDPANAQGYTNISNVGQSLLSIKPMGNGYGQQGLMAQGGAGMPASGGRYQPQPMQQQQQTMPYQMPEQPQNPAFTPVHAQSPALAPPGPYTQAAAPPPAPVAPPAAPVQQDDTQLRQWLAAQGYSDPMTATWNLPKGYSTPIDRWTRQSDMSPGA